MQQRALRAAWAVLALIWLGQAAELALDAWPPVLQPPPQPAGEGVERLLWGDRLDPNRAPREALMALPGIGPVLADAIAAARPFCEVAELSRVRGIGTVRLSRLAHSLEIRDRPKECGGGPVAASAAPEAGS